MIVSVPGGHLGVLGGLECRSPARLSLSSGITPDHVGGSPYLRGLRSSDGRSTRGGLERTMSSGWQVGPRTASQAKSSGAAPIDPPAGSPNVPEESRRGPCRLSRRNPALGALQIPEGSGLQAVARLRIDRTVVARPRCSGSRLETYAPRVRPRSPCAAAHDSGGPRRAGPYAPTLPDWARPVGSRRSRPSRGGLCDRHSPSCVPCGSMIAGDCQQWHQLWVTKSKNGRPFDLRRPRTTEA